MTFAQYFRPVIQVYTDGAPAVKAGASGFALIAAALTDTAGGILFAGVCTLWFLDLLLGVARAVAERRFSFAAFLHGFGKLVGAGCGIGVAVVLDEIGQGMVGVYDGQLAASAAMAGVIVAFAASAVENFGFWFPEAADGIQQLLNRRRGESPPPVDWYRMPQETQTRIRAILADEQGGET